MIDVFNEIIERLEELPYEEWLVTIQDYIVSDIQLAYRVLRHIAFNHDDSSWRFNAIQILIDSNLLCSPQTTSLSGSPTLMAFELGLSQEFMQKIHLIPFCFVIGNMSFINGPVNNVG